MLHTCKSNVAGFPIYPFSVRNEAEFREGNRMNVVSRKERKEIRSSSKVVEQGRELNQ